MFTRNYYELLYAVMNYERAGKLKNTSGKYISTGYMSTGELHLCLRIGTNTVLAPTMKTVQRQDTGYNFGGVIFGSGTAQPTLDDYKLSGSLITTITASVTVNKKTTDTGYEIEGIYTLTNSGSAPVTVGEVALITTTSTSNFGENLAIIVERTVLDTPITIPAGGVGQVTYTIRMNYPTA